MGLGRLAAVWLIGAALGGCSLTGAFSCEQDADCLGSQADGTCEPNGFCSFPDGDCPSGRRFGDLAGDGLAGECTDVEVGSTTTGMTTPATSSSTQPPSTTATTDVTTQTTSSSTLPLSETGSSSDSGSTGGEPCVASVRANEHFTCAFTNRGRLQCWGSNEYGQLGNGRSMMDRTVPVEVPISEVTELDLGAFHTIAVTEDSVFAWGRNDYGEAIPPPTMPVTVPTSLSVDPTAVVGGGFHTCGFQNGGMMGCWGRNEDGQVGTAVSMWESGTFLPLNDVTAAAAGGFHTCAVASDVLQCWGRNVDFQLGDDLATTGPALVVVPLPGTPVALAAGDFHTCAINDNDEGFCWGQDLYGQTGDGTADDGSHGMPTAVVGLPSVGRIAAGDDHTCAISPDGTLWCWGRNDAGQLGVDPTPSEPQAIEVPMLAEVVDVALGRNHTCAALGDGSVYCWGSNASGQLGTDGGAETSPALTLFECDP